MSYKIDDLQLRDGTKLFPNILKENIPNGAIDANKLASDLVNLINGKANASDVYTKAQIDNMLADLDDYYTKSEIDTKFLQYYTKSQVDGLIPDMTRYYTKTEIDEDFYNKVQINNNYYTKSEVNSLIPSLSNYYNKTEIDGLLTNYYTKTETQGLLTDMRQLMYSLTRIYTLQGTSGYLTAEQLTDIKTNENAIIKVLLRYGVNDDPTFFRRDYEDVDSTDIIFRHIAGYDPTLIEYNNLTIDKTTGQWYVQSGQVQVPVASNYYTKTQVDTLLNDKLDKDATSIFYDSLKYDEVNDVIITNSLLYANYDIKVNSFNDIYTGGESSITLQGALDTKADKSTTYTKTEVDGLLNSKQNTLTTTSVTSGTLNEAVGFDTNGNLVRGTVGGGGSQLYLHNILIQQKYVDPHDNTIKKAVYAYLNIINSSSTPLDTVTAIKNYLISVKGSQSSIVYPCNGSYNVANGNYIDKSVPIYGVKINVSNQIVAVVFTPTNLSGASVYATTASYNAQYNYCSDTEQPISESTSSEYETYIRDSVLAL